MADAAFVLILLVASPDPIVDAVKVSAVKSLGALATVYVETAASRNDDEARSLARRREARAIADLRFDGPSQRVAQLHVHVDPGEGWLDDTIVFNGDDSEIEKGRALGYALASMVSSLDGSLRRPAGPVAQAEPKVELPAQPPARQPAFRAWLFTVGIGSVDSTVASVGLAGGAGFLAGRWGARLVGGGRVGQLEAVDIDARTLMVGAGPVVRVAERGRWELALSADVLLQNQSFARLEARQSRWVGAADLRVEGSFALRPAHVTAGVGVEAGFGSTTLEVGPVTERVPPVRAVAQIGIRFDFPIRSPGRVGR